jgi:hypothetical protein
MQYIAYCRFSFPTVTTIQVVQVGKHCAICESICKRNVGPSIELTLMMERGPLLA